MAAKIDDIDAWIDGNGKNPLDFDSVDLPELGAPYPPPSKSGRWLAIVAIVVLSLFAMFMLVGLFIASGGIVVDL